MYVIKSKDYLIFIMDIVTKDFIKINRLFNYLYLLTFTKNGIISITTATSTRGFVIGESIKSRTASQKSN